MDFYLEGITVEPLKVETSFKQSSSKGQSKETMRISYPGNYQTCMHLFHLLKQLVQVGKLRRLIEQCDIVDAIFKFHSSINISISSFGLFNVITFSSDKTKFTEDKTRRRFG